MTDLNTWFDSSSNLLTDERTLVDSAGCEFGEIDRPAREYLEWAKGDEQKFMLKAPESPNGFIKMEDPVALESKR